MFFLVHHWNYIKRLINLLIENETRRNKMKHKLASSFVQNMHRRNIHIAIFKRQNISNEFLNPGAFDNSHNTKSLITDVHVNMKIVSNNENNRTLNWHNPNRFYCDRTMTIDKFSAPQRRPGKCMTTSDTQTAEELSLTMNVYENFVSPEEEQQLLNEIEPYMKRLRYEYDHWDGAIHGYRETERSKWTEKNDAVLKRVRDLAFPPNVPQLAYVHILDLSKDGYIKPHIDAVRYCGSTIAGLCLLSSCVMRLVHEEDKLRHADVLLNRRSLYIMKDAARYKYTHEVLPNESSVFDGVIIPRDRRISVIMRNEANLDTDS